jgi:transposase-like protein
MYGQPHCPQCRSGWASPHYQRSETGEECLRYWCIVCGYTWTEPCADAVRHVGQRRPVWSTELPWRCSHSLEDNLWPPRDWR